MINNNAPLVSVLCTAFNHVNYIEDAINRMMNQKCSFSYEIIIHDDASTDGTGDKIVALVKNHDNVKTILQRENQFSKGIKIWSQAMLPHAAGKYIAICDGDDYWIDENKLQVQVDFLEKNPDYSICWTGYNMLEDDSLIPAAWLSDYTSDTDVTMENIFQPYRTYSLTAVFRRDTFDEKIYNALAHAKDNSMYAICLSNGKGRLMRMITANYRVHDGGVFSRRSYHFKIVSSYYNYKEIWLKIKGAKTPLIYNLVKYYLSESVVFTPLRLNKINLRLAWDSFSILGFKKSISLFWNKLRYRIVS